MGADVAGRRQAVGLGQAIRVLGRSREATLVVVMVVLSAIVELRAPQFLSAGNLTQVTALAAIIAIAAVGEALVVITRNVDLSVESTMALVAFVIGELLAQHVLSTPAAWAAGLVLGLVLGMINGLVVTVLRVPSIVATLGTLSIFRGVVFFIAGGHEVDLSDLPAGYTGPATQTIAGLPLFVIVAIVIAVAIAAALRFSRFGRRLYAVGNDPEAAAIIGVRGRWTVFVAFAACGLLAGLAGILWGIEFGTLTATSASGQVLQVVAAVVVGGVTISGGSGTVIGAALGALFLGLINNALLVLQLPQELLQAVYGAVILVAVAADALVQRGAATALLRRPAR